MKLCHYVSRSDKGCFFFPTVFEGKNFLVGKKMFINSEKALFSPGYMVGKRYTAEKSENCIVLSSEPQIQHVTFSVPCSLGAEKFVFHFETSSIIKAGIHISPLRKGFDCRFDRVTYEIPVLFLLGDVVFYDGMDVSVEKLTIPINNIPDIPGRKKLEKFVEENRCRIQELGTL